ncbi:MAG: S1 family peptidase [Planctomycetia bacterium]
MIFVRLLLIGGAIFFLNTCRQRQRAERRAQKDASAVVAPATPAPEQPPALPPTAALRPVYQLAQGPSAAGTAFLVADSTGKRAMLTAVHVMDDAAGWKEVVKGSLHSMEGGELVALPGRPTYLGRSFDEGDASDDLVVWPLGEKGAELPALTLATADPAPGDWVWIVGRPYAEGDGPQKTYRAQVMGEELGGLTVRLHDRFEMRGFSGGPVVDAQGRLVGSTLGGDSEVAIISTPTGLRKTLAAAGFTVP